MEDSFNNLKCKNCGKPLKNKDTNIAMDNDKFVIMMSVECEDCKHTNTFTLRFDDLEMGDKEVL